MASHPRHEPGSRAATQLRPGRTPTRETSASGLRVVGKPGGGWHRARPRCVPVPGPPVRNEETLERTLFIRMLVRHAYREQLAAERFRGAVQIAPDNERPRLLDLALEEDEHYLGCCRVAASNGIAIEALVSQRMLLAPGIPVFATWLDVLLARAFNDQAGYHVLRGVIGCKLKDYGALAHHIVAEEREHGAEGAALLIEYTSTIMPHTEATRRAVATHLAAAIRCIGRPDTEGDREAVRLGLKTQSSAATLAEFCDYSDSVLARASLTEFLPLRSNVLNLIQGFPP